MSNYAWDTVLQLPEVDVLITGPVNSLSIPGFGAVVVRIWNGSATSSAIRGIANGVHGRVIFITLVAGRTPITFPGGHSSAATGEKLAVEDGTNISSVAMNQTIQFIYDANYSGGGRWVQVGLVA
jgi:hypothetical protein